MPQVGIKYGGNEYTWDEARALADDPSFPYPPPLVEAMAAQREDQQPSASSVTGCLRRFELQRKVSYYGEASGELPPLFGTAFHDFMDNWRKRIIKPGELTETRLAAEVDLGPQHNGDRTEYADVVLPFSGKFDFFSPGKLVSDWKSKLYIPVGFEPPREHKGQVNIYNWLASENGLEPAPTWELAYVSQNWAARFQEPTADVRRIGDYVRTRLRLWYGHSSRGVLPPPLPAVYEENKGKPVAPCNYCPVREHCLAELREDAPRPF